MIIIAIGLALFVLMPLPVIGSISAALYTFLYLGINGIWARSDLVEPQISFWLWPILLFWGVPRMRRHWPSIVDAVRSSETNARAWNDRHGVPQPEQRSALYAKRDGAIDVEFTDVSR